MSSICSVGDFSDWDVLSISGPCFCGVWSITRQNVFSWTDGRTENLFIMSDSIMWFRKTFVWLRHILIFKSFCFWCAYVKLYLWYFSVWHFVLSGYTFLMLSTSVPLFPLSQKDIRLESTFCGPSPRYRCSLCWMSSAKLSDLIIEKTLICFMFFSYEV